jgi:hypothetical protein
MDTTNRSVWSSTKPDSAPRLISIGDAIAAGSYHLHSRFEHALNFVCNDELAVVVDGTVGRGPLNIVLDDVDWNIGSELYVEYDSINLSGATLPAHDEHRYDSDLATIPVTDVACLRSNSAQFEAAILLLASPESLAFLLTETTDDTGQSTFQETLRGRFREARAMVLNGRFLDAATAVRGLGIGLTPAGDDFLAGLMIALHIRRKCFGEDLSAIIDSIFAASQSKQLLSQAFLRCARDGRVSEKLRNVIATLFEQESRVVPEYTRELLSLGATSGADTATGMALGLRQYFRYEKE